MSSLFCHIKAPVTAELICISLLFFKIVLGLVQLMAVDVRYSVRDDMAVQVVFVLVDADQVLELIEEPGCKLSADIKALCCGDPFIFVEADDVVGIHPARIFSPLLLLVQEAPVHTAFVYLVGSVGTGDIDKAFRDLVAPEDIGDDVAHRPVALCRAIDDLIDCHIFSLSFLYPLISRDIFSSTRIPGA